MSPKPLRRMVCLFGVLAVSGGVPASDALPPGARMPGTVGLSVDLKGREVRIELAGSAASLLGFDHPPRTDAEREAVRLARDNLKIGDAMVRLNIAAACRLAEVRVQLGAPAGQDAKGHLGAVTARYRFDCDQPARLESAALGLFAGFPAIERALVTYQTPGGRGSAELTPTNPVVNFIPF